MNNNTDYNFPFATITRSRIEVATYLTNSTSLNSLKKFIKSFYQNNLTLHYPTEKQPGGLTGFIDITGAMFKEKIIDQDEDCFVYLYYSRDCQQCVNVQNNITIGVGNLSLYSMHMGKNRSPYVSENDERVVYYSKEGKRQFREKSVKELESLQLRNKLYSVYNRDNMQVENFEKWIDQVRNNITVVEEKEEDVEPKGS